MVAPGPRLASIPGGLIGTVSVVVEINAKVSTLCVPIEYVPLGIIDCLAGLNCIPVIDE